MNDRLTKIVTVLLIPITFSVFLTIVILGSVPPVDRDALTHHLFVPKLYLQHGGIYEIPEIPFSYYPMNLDLLYLIPLYFGNDIVPKYIHFFFSLATAFLIYQFLKNRIGIPWGLFGALFFMTIPVVIKLSITVYVDLGLVFFSTAAMMSLITWINKDFKMKFLILSGLCAGLAAGTKYNGIVTILILALLVPFLYSRYMPRTLKRSELKLSTQAIALAMVFILAAFMSYGPWMVRNYIWTGNPVYPLHNQLFVKESKIEQVEKNLITGTDDLQKAKVENKGNIFTMRRTLYNESALDTLLLPVRFFFQGQDDNPRYFDGRLNPFLLILPLILLAFLSLGKRDSFNKRELLVLFSFSFLYFFLVFFQTAMRVRYVAPSLPPLIILSTLAIHTILDFLKSRFPSSYAWLTLLVAIAILQPNFKYLTRQFNVVKPFPYITNNENRDDYITRYRPEYPAVQWLNERTSRDERVLCIFLGNRGYYMEFFPVFTNLFRGLPADSDKKFRYVLVRNDLFLNWLRYTLQKDQNIDLPFSYAEPVFSSHAHSIFSITRANQPDF